MRKANNVRNLLISVPLFAVVYQHVTYEARAYATMDVALPFT
ncbi:hypothetical protein [Psychrobacter sp.]|nr:hypothetical protein [uncultured Psychrobacter sp.]